tara:strand:+ start:94 stop:804 length:711 start_codon:yes stop_codon:yes gene_type:complete
MRAYAIVLNGNDASAKAFATCRESSFQVNNPFEVFSWNATPAENAETELKKSRLQWTYPWQGVTNDLRSGLVLSAYQTANPAARIGCFMSHYYLWNHCAGEDEPFLIMEHDAEFTHTLSKTALIEILKSPFGVIGINDPRGATRKSEVYHGIVQKNMQAVQHVPKIDEFNIPQGIAGNSAYIIKPDAAWSLVTKAKDLGAWPNDALMCYQNFPSNFLGQTRMYYTKVQGIRSTTTL